MMQARTISGCLILTAQKRKIRKFENQKFPKLQMDCFKLSKKGEGKLGGVDPR